MVNPWNLLLICIFSSLRSPVLVKYLLFQVWLYFFPNLNILDLILFMQVKLSYIYTLYIEERPITVPVFHSEDLLNIFTPRGRQPYRPRSVMCLVFSPSKLHRKSLMDYFEPDKNIQGSEWWDSWIPPAHGPLRSLSLIINPIMQLQARLEKKPGTSLALQDHGCVPLPHGRRCITVPVLCP